MNSLSKESSPYLLQHQNNPVHWFPWGDAAFTKAKAENKPIFLSIGYSTCHWCHVMAQESFENPALAEILNRDFISIKVDREERPDVDRVYMAFVQASTGSGGWPLSAWLTPDGDPFFGGTYFPPENRHGRAGFGNVCQKIAEQWQSHESRIRAHGQEVIESLQASTRVGAPSSVPQTGASVDLAFERFERTFDSTWGGFGNAPKFPRPSVFHFLLRDAYFSKRPRSKELVLLTLKKMAEGGIHDHLGGGFHRYSVDEFWHVPHFEKMLYDQAQLAISYLEAYQVSQDADFAGTVRDILHYVSRDLCSPEGGFYSAEDADSSISHTDTTHAEGAFYVWTMEEIRRNLTPAEADAFILEYGVEPNGNTSEASDPHGEFRGKNILIRRPTPAPQRADALRQACAKLLVLRNQRPRPHLDDKILTAWNALMISAFAKAGNVFDQPEYITVAQRALAFLRENLWDGQELYRSWRKDTRTTLAFAEDYAFLIKALLDLYEITFDPKNLTWAQELQTKQDALFWDESLQAYFSNRSGDPHLKVRMKEDYDGAEPSANSVSAENLLRLSCLLHDQNLESKVNRLFENHSSFAQIPQAIPYLLAAKLISNFPHKEIRIAGDLNAPQMAEMLKILRENFLPDTVVSPASATETSPIVSICTDSVCLPPISDPMVLRKSLLSSELKG